MRERRPKELCFANETLTRIHECCNVLMTHLCKLAARTSSPCSGTESQPLLAGRGGRCSRTSPSPCSFAASSRQRWWSHWVSPGGWSSSPLKERSPLKGTYYWGDEVEEHLAVSVIGYLGILAAQSACRRPHTAPSRRLAPWVGRTHRSNLCHTWRCFRKPACHGQFFRVEEVLAVDSSPLQKNTGRKLIQTNLQLNLKKRF